MGDVGGVTGGTIHNEDEVSVFRGFDGEPPRRRAPVEVLKRCLLEVAMDGAEKALRDRRSRRRVPLGNDSGKRLASCRVNVDNASCASRTCRESEKCKKLGENAEDNGLFPDSNRMVQEEWDADEDELENSEVEEYKSLYKPKRNCSSYTDFTLFQVSLPAILMGLALKFLTFQLNLILSFLAFPIWLSYVSFMLMMFPVYTLRQLRAQLMRKLLNILGWKSVGRMAVRIGCAFFRSVYVCFFLVGLLVSGFVLGAVLMRFLDQEPVVTNETLNFDYTKSSPVAYVPLKSSPWSHRAIPYGQKLQLCISLTMPESNYNRKLGIFQVRVEFLSRKGKVTASGSCPCMLQFNSRPIRLLQTAIRTAPLLAGFRSESQTINVRMELREGPEPTTWVRVSLKQRAENRDGAGVPEIYDARLRLEYAMLWSRKIFWAWRKTAFVWLSFVVFLTELVIVLVFCRPLILPQRKSRARRRQKKTSTITRWGK